MLHDTPLSSVICVPEPDATPPAGEVAFRGYAVASGRPIVRVELTADGGRTWVQARIVE